MLRFFQNSHDPFYFLLLKFVQSPNEPLTRQEVIYSVDDSISLPNMSSFCIPQKNLDSLSDGEVRFVFYLKSNDLYPTYGYVVQIVKNQKRTAYCLLSPYYSPQKLFSIITKFLMKQQYEQKDFLARNIKPDFNSPQSYMFREREQVLNGIRQLISLLDPELIAYLIVYLVLDSHIVITSSNYEILSLFAFSILSTIHPLMWPGVFIPVLPESMTDAILAPFPYIIGLHSSLASRAQDSEAESHILINVDEKTMSFYPEMIKIPQKIRRSIDYFKKKVSGLTPENYHIFPNFSHQLIIECISYAVDKSGDKPQKLLKHWNKLKVCHNLKPFIQMVCQSQLVLFLMREIENSSESLVYKAYFESKQYEPISTKEDFKVDKKAKKTRQRSGTSYQQNNPKTEFSDSGNRPASQTSNTKARQVSSVKLPQSIEVDSNEQQLNTSPKSASTPELKVPLKSHNNQQRFDCIKQIEVLATLFASKYENGGCIDNRFKKKDFRTNAGIDTPENLSFSTKLNLYNNGFDGSSHDVEDNDNNDNDDSNAGQKVKSETKKKTGKKPPFLPHIPKKK